MYNYFSKPTRIQGFLAAILLLCFSLFWVGCSQDSQMSTNPSTDLNNQMLNSFSTDLSGDLALAKQLSGSAALSDISLLGSASSFAVLGASTVTSTGLTVLTGDLGVSPGTAITGFGPGVVNGTIHAGDDVALQAQADLTTAYNALAGLPCGTELTGQDLGGMTLEPGVYCFTSSAQLTGTLFLDAQGNSNSVFIFQIASTITTGTNAAVVMINGGQDCNVFWQVGSSATLGTGTAFLGSILAYASITLNTGVSLSGRALARTAAVTMDNDTVSAESCGQGQSGFCRDKVTGGGSIDVSGGFANFGFNVQQKKNGDVKGELQYKDHVSGSKIHIRDFTSLLVVGNTATFSGTGTINRMPGSFLVTVTDKGRHGSNDWFSIAVLGGQTSEGTLRSGNIKIHKKNCGDGNDHNQNDDEDDDDGDGHDGHKDHDDHDDH